ncbi:GDSL esterase/lipase [Platanthera zijinensis]|uniref:GDSL esterase/lipase n=1 Tax=Platanthera zijinensis TaxID=2320716 RepID=A0AAP0GC62_9ASPA
MFYEAKKTCLFHWPERHRGLPCSHMKICVINNGCCGIGRNGGQKTCLPFQTPWSNREEYVFWDAFHPTEKVNLILVTRAFNDSGDGVILINIQLLAIAEPLSWKEEGAGKPKNGLRQFKNWVAENILGCD